MSWTSSTDERESVHTGFWWAGLRERDHFEVLGVYGRIILKWMLNYWSGEVWTGLIYLRMGTGDGLL
jgi:hypothetical protein